MKSDLADVTFVVEGVKIPAHKFILATQSSYFREKCYVGSQKEIALDIKLKTFKLILKYCYSGQMSLADMNEVVNTLVFTHQYGFETLKLSIEKQLVSTLSLANMNTEDVRSILILTRQSGFEFMKLTISELLISSLSSANKETEDLVNIIALAHEYGFDALELSIFEWLISDLSLELCFTILNSTESFWLDALRDICATFMDRNATKVLSQDAFKRLKQDDLCKIIARDSFFAPEKKIYKAVCGWIKNNSIQDKDIRVKWKIIDFTFNYSVVKLNFLFFTQTVTSLVRLPLIEITELWKMHDSSDENKPFKKDQIIAAIKEKTTTKNGNLPHRVPINIEKNVASTKCNSKVICADSRSALLDDDVKYHSKEKGKYNQSDK